MGKLNYLVAAENIDKISANNSVTNSVTNSKKEVIVTDEILKLQDNLTNGNPYISFW